MHCVWDAQQLDVCIGDTFMFSSMSLIFLTIPSKYICEKSFFHVSLLFGKWTDALREELMMLIKTTDGVGGLFC